MTEAILAILQEALSNVVRHAHASAIDVEVRASDDIELVVRDDGVGLHEGTVVVGDGLRNMRRRVEALGGTLHIEPVDPTGTQVRWRVPAR